MSSSVRANRLIEEKSPYLLQHAYNPVDWYAWGEAAFATAKREDKPIFLSVGYSTCHWCHVMEEESFSNNEIAQLINENFVPVKVDREERPDVDHIYMQAVMALTGQGGWPMTVFLTPDLKPFYGGTYFPPEDRWGRPGLANVLRAISSLWKHEKGKVLDSGEELVQAIQSAAAGSGRGAMPGEDVLGQTVRDLASQFDAVHGGFGGAPKFPRSHVLSFLLRQWKRTQDGECLAIVEKTLDAMAGGGIYDHVGGGFHRYSTDERWHVPHFEKMLYDQALLAQSYLEAYQATRQERHARAARGIFEYVLAHLTDPEGGFYSAEDADSAADPTRPKEKSEGAYYAWTEKEIISVLGEERARLFNRRFGVQSDGNAVHDPVGELRGKNVLYVAAERAELAKEFGISEAEVEKSLKESLLKIAAARAARLKPHLDDKVLVDWNGLMVSALAYGSRVLREPRYGKAAKAAADFVLRKMKRRDGRLMHRYADGHVAVPGFVEDYAFFTLGLCDLYEATFDPHYLREAKSLAQEMVRLFWDEAGGGFFITGHDAESLIVRPKEFYDGAVPSGNSVAALALARLAQLTMDKSLEDYARRTVEAASQPLSRYPSQFPEMLMALDFLLGPSREIVIAGDEDEALEKAVEEVYARFLPNKVVLFHPSEEEDARKLQEIVPFLKNLLPRDGRTTVYVCKNYVCELPVTDMAKLPALLDS
jgi:uncharacterized protein YyaL (SSP411 family)